eukprot:TRINITY_DN1599_c1_g1_i1.p1 TRINITY_DN1599_c1_g1~~TRINITY_DN1599_c1_g1_i1.p1  ORF type:complete len:524 (+),score=59.51 TRINITY_DN1599_c1_g1_i1:189-1760(+)
MQSPPNQMQGQTVTELISSREISPKKAVSILYEESNDRKKCKGKEKIVDYDLPPNDFVERLLYTDRFPYKPSDLFLRIFNQVYKCAETGEKLAGMISPRLLSTSGIVRATLLGTTCDIIRYIAKCMLNAEKEILFSTGFWKDDSKSAKLVRDGFIALNNVLQQKNGNKITVKMMWCRGQHRRSVHTQAAVNKKVLDNINVPTLECPYLDFEAMDFYRLFLGVLHFKFMIIDRRTLLIFSNNINDKPNVEMCVHLEGDIVNSYYDTFVINWGKKFSTLPPCINDPSPILPDISYFQRFQESFLRDPFFESPLSQLFYHFPRTSAPMAAVHRLPHGSPGHSSKYNPQDVAWRSAFALARNSIYIQTPDFNAVPAIKGVIRACARGVKVTIWLCYGYNALKERFPRQGGENAHVIKKMYQKLQEIHCEQNLVVCWYVAKNQTRPQKSIPCHVKFMSIDDSVAIVGSGNMDVQSWYHSAECNVMVDSKEVVAEWMQYFRDSQNTEINGKVDGALPNPEAQINRVLGL